MTRSVCPNRVQGRSRSYYTSQTDGFWMSHERSQTNNPKEKGSSSTMAKYYNKDASYVQYSIAAAAGHSLDRVRASTRAPSPRGEGRSTASRSRDRGRGVAAREVGPDATPRPQARDLLRRPPAQPSAPAQLAPVVAAHTFISSCQMCRTDQTEPARGWRGKTNQAVYALYYVAGRQSTPLPRKREATLRAPVMSMYAPYVPRTAIL